MGREFTYEGDSRRHHSHDDRHPYRSSNLSTYVLQILTSYGVFLSYYISTSKFPGTSDLDYTFVGGINFAAAMLVAVSLSLRQQDHLPAMHSNPFLTEMFSFPLLQSLTQL